LKIKANGTGDRPAGAGDHHRQRLADGAACLAAALDYRRRGWPVLPLCPPDHMGVGKSHGKECEQPGKVPVVLWKEYQQAPPEEDDVRRWWQRNPTLNVGTALGPAAGLVRLDVDGPGGEALLAELSGGDLPPTLEFTSGRENAGRGLLYAIPTGVEFQTTYERPKTDEELRFQALGAQTVLPPSRHVSGSLYQWLPGHGPADIDPAPAPTWMVKRWGEHGDGRKRHDRAEPLGEGEPIEKGVRDTKLTSVAGTMRRRGLDREEILAALLVMNERRCRPPLADHVIEKIARSVAGYEPTETILITIGMSGRLPGQQPLSQDEGGDPKDTDCGNARRLVARHGAALRHCHPWRSWLVWDGRRWRPDDTAEATRRAKETIDFLFRQAEAEVAEVRKQLEAGQGDEAELKGRLASATRRLKFCLKSQAAQRVNAMLDMARSEPGVPILPAEMDVNPRLLNVENGTIDLRTGELRPHRQEDLITKLAPVVYDPDAHCPLWERCLSRWMDGNKGLTDYLRRVAGYWLTGDVSEQCLWFFHGAGANGKSTFLLALLSLLGDYGMQAVADLLMTKKHEAHPTERADLFGKRLVATIETEEGKRLAEALMKQLTGGDKVRARKMRQDFFEFSPTHKIVLAANHKPQVRGTDHAAWRRIKLVPFVVTIPDHEKDKQLADRLKAESSGVLAWAVAGCLDWYRHGMQEPDEVRQATEAYRREQDVICTFITECCHCQAEARVKVSALYEAYGRWSGDRFTTQPAFNEKLRANGYESRRGHGGSYFWYGLALDQDGPRVNLGEPVPVNSLENDFS
jgi:putative DNA primase/helicase